MFADMLPPPTFVFDWAYLGAPQGLIALGCVVAALIALFFLLARTRLHKLWIVLICVGLFFVADLAVYFISINLPRTSPRPPDSVSTRE